MIVEISSPETKIHTKQFAVLHQLSCVLMMIAFIMFISFLFFLLSLE